MEEFEIIVSNFVEDLNITFPEYGPTISKWWKIDASPEKKEKALIFIKRYCIHVYTPLINLFFEENDNIFDGDEPLELLPQICFRKLWKCNLSENTKKCLWSHIKLVSLYVFKENQTALIPSHEQQNTYQKFKDSMKDTQIGKFTDELIDSLFGENENKDPQSLLKNMLNPSKFSTILESVSSNIEKKIETGEIEPTKLTGELQGIVQKFDNPILNNLFNNLNTNNSNVELNDFSDLIKLFTNT